MGENAREIISMSRFLCSFHEHPVLATSELGEHGFLARHSMAAPVKPVDKYLLLPSKIGQLGHDVSLESLPLFSI